MKETIGWIGVGSMGHRMSRHLHKAGYPLVVADAMSTERAPEGASIAKSNAEVAARAATVILSLPDDFTEKDITPKEIVFVLDTSGSMSGFPIEKAKERLLSQKPKERVEADGKKALEETRTYMSYSSSGRTRTDRRR